MSVAIYRVGGIRHTFQESPLPLGILGGGFLLPVSWVAWRAPRAYARYRSRASDPDRRQESPSRPGTGGGFLLGLADEAQFSGDVLEAGPYGLVHLLDGGVCRAVDL